jgi:hypothetical protein
MKDDLSQIQTQNEKTEEKSHVFSIFKKQIDVIITLMKKEKVKNLLIVKFFFHLSQGKKLFSFFFTFKIVFILFFFLKFHLFKIVLGREQFGDFMSSYYSLDSSYIAYILSYSGIIVALSGSFIFFYFYFYFTNYYFFF